MAGSQTTTPRVLRQLTALRAQVLQLAVQGKLVAQQPSDEPVVPPRERHGLRASPSILPLGWTEARLGDVVLSLEQGWSPRCENRPSDSSDEWAVIKTTAIQALAFTDAENKALPGSLVPRPAIEINQGDILITRAGPRERCGVCCYVSATRPRLMLCDKAYRFRAEPSLAENEFCALALNAPSLRQFIENMKTGGSESGLNLTQRRFLELMLPLPPIAEQRRIVAKANELMAGIDGLEALLKRVDALRPKLLQLAAQGALVPQDPAEDPASDEISEIAAERERLTKAKVIRKARPVPPISAEDVPYPLPRGWEWARIRGVSRDLGPATPEERFTYLDVSSIDPAAARVASPQVLEPDQAPSRARKTVDRGSVLYSTVRPLLGNIALVDEEIEPRPIASTAFAVVHPLGGISGDYLVAVLRAGVTRAFVESRMKGASYPAINDSDFERILIPVPPIAEQVRIVEQLRELTGLIDSLAVSVAR